MRPLIDIPHQLHGEVKDYAEAEGMTINEAYIKAIKRGLDGGRGDE